MPRVELDIVTITNLHTEVTNLLSEPDLSFALKYDLSKIYEKTKAISGNYETQRIGIIRKYGKELPDKSITLEGSKDSDKGIEELIKLQNKKETLDHTLKLADFEDFKPKRSYIEIMKFIEK